MIIIVLSIIHHKNKTEFVLLLKVNIACVIILSDS
jgi:hypothetical protein